MKLTQRQLENHLWGAANILRGKTVGQDYKNYILSLMFYKRLCDQWENEADEAIAEKLRAALTRLEPAIRDFFDIDYLVSQHKINLKDQQLLQLVAEKLKVPENPPVDLSPARKDKLKTQINTELKPVLRSADFESFNLDRAFGLVAEIAGH